MRSSRSCWAFALDQAAAAVAVAPILAGILLGIPMSIEPLSLYLAIPRVCATIGSALLTRH